MAEAEAAEALAVLSAGGEPTVSRRVLGPEIDIAVFLFDQQCRAGAGWDLRVMRTQKLERPGIEVFDHAKARDFSPGVHRIESRVVGSEENNAR